MLYGSHIKNWHLANHMKKQNKKLWNAKSIGEKLKTKCLMFFVPCFNFMWFARFQILICGPKSIWRKLLVLSLLYKKLMNSKLPSQPISSPNLKFCHIELARHATLDATNVLNFYSPKSCFRILISSLNLKQNLGS
jgi:hypothetical protein